MSEGAGALIDPAAEFARLLATPSLGWSEVLDCRVLRDHVVQPGVP